MLHVVVHILVPWVWLVHSFAQVKLRFAKLDTGVSLHSIEGKGFQRDSLWLRASSFSTFARATMQSMCTARRWPNSHLLSQLTFCCFVYMCVYICMYVSSYSYTVVTYFYDYIPTITLPVNRSAHPRPLLHCAFGTGTFPASERVGEVSTFNSSASGESGFPALCCLAAGKAEC